MPMARRRRVKSILSLILNLLSSHCNNKLEILIRVILHYKISMQGRVHGAFDLCRGR